MAKARGPLSAIGAVEVVAAHQRASGDPLMPIGPRHVWVDGRIQPADVPHLSAFDRGFQLGDGVFETLRARDGRPDRAGRARRPPATVRGGPGHPPARRHRGATDRRRRRAAGRRGPGRTRWRRLDPHHRQPRADRRPRPAAARRAAGADARRPGLAGRCRRRPTTWSVACTSSPAPCGATRRTRWRRSRRPAAPTSSTPESRRARRARTTPSS